MKNMKKLTFNEFWNSHCDGQYNPHLPIDVQGVGYVMVRKMIADNITPASLEEAERWRTNPTKDELYGKPDLKYLRFLHPVLRPIIIENWEMIKSLEL